MNAHWGPTFPGTSPVVSESFRRKMKLLPTLASASSPVTRLPPDTAVIIHAEINAPSAPGVDRLDCVVAVQTLLLACSRLPRPGTALHRPASCSTAQASGWHEQSR